MRRSMKLMMAGLAAYGLFALVGGSRRGGEQEDGEHDHGRLRAGRDSDAERGGPGERWDEVDEASLESFPASDPPSHSRGKL